MGSASSIIEISQVRQSFRTGFWLKRVEILHGITFKISKNSIFGLLGANGAGKTTLIHLIAGFKKAIHGEVQVGGFAAHTKEARSKIGYLPERPYFHEHLTGEELLKFMGVLSGLSMDTIKSRIPTVLAQVGLSHAGAKELKSYSKGMMQRIGIAQAIIHNPDILILDEPTSGLDPVGRMEVRDLILSLHRLGKTILFSSHIIPDVEAICDEIAVIEKGNLIHHGKVRDFFDTKSSETEFIFEGQMPGILLTKFAGAKVEESSSGLRVVTKDRAQKEALFKEALQAGWPIYSINPVRPSLEDFFTKGAQK